MSAGVLHHVRAVGAVRMGRSGTVENEKWTRIETKSLKEGDAVPRALCYCHITSQDPFEMF